MKSYAEFTAHFTAESAAEFGVNPKQGMLEPYGKDGTTFIVSFTPTEYGKAKIGKLVIQTEEMQWTYEVRGQHPKYVAPTDMEPKVDSRLPIEMASQLGSQGVRRNYVKENLLAAGKRTTREASGFR